MGNGVSLKDEVKEQKRLIKRQSRVLDREITRLQKEKQNLTWKIKTVAKNNEIELLRAYSEEFVMYKINTVKLIDSKNQMSALCQQIQMMNSKAEITRAIRGMTVVMKRINNSLKSADISRLISEFQDACMDNEIQGQELDQAMHQEVDEEERDDVMNQVLEEIGVSLGNDIQSVPKTDKYMDRLNEIYA